MDNKQYIDFVTLHIDGQTIVVKNVPIRDYNRPIEGTNGKWIILEPEKSVTLSTNSYLATL